MKKSILLKTITLTAALLGLAACAQQSPPNAAMLDHAPTYNDRGSYDDNGVEPAPNNGNQNFGRRF